MRFPLRTPLALTAATVGVAAAAIAAPAAMAAPATIGWDNGSDTTSSINQGEAVTWDVQGGGHNIDVTRAPRPSRAPTARTPSARSTRTPSTSRAPTSSSATTTAR